MDVYYTSHAFRFAPTPGDPWNGRLLLDHDQRVLLAELLEAEDENWCLDADGFRLPPEQLFARSPWSADSLDGPCKLLCRFINPEDGAVIFSTRENYPGDTTDWIYDRAR